MRLRAAIGAMAVTAALALIGAGATPAQAAATCTWGGTPAAPTGTTTIHPGVTNSPSLGPLHFEATGALAGGCTGTFKFIGQMNAGATCGLITFEGITQGLPGVARFAGVSVGGIAPARLYDRAGNVVGSENAQFLTGSNVMDCNTPVGMTSNHFSSVIELFDNHR